MGAKKRSGLSAGIEKLGPFLSSFYSVDICLAISHESKRGARELEEMPEQNLGFQFVSMDLNLVLKGLDFSGKRKRWLLFLAAFGFSSYGAYRAYHSPVITRKRKRVLKFLGSLISLAEAASDSASTIGVLSRDLKGFLQSESDEIPNSLKQVSKLHMSKEFSQSLVKATQVLTMGVVSGYRLGTRTEGSNVDPSLIEQAMDKLFTKAGAGFASLVVGSFARNLVMAFHSTDSTSIGPVQGLVDVVCGDQKCKQLIGDCVQLFVSIAIAVYLDKTADTNTFDQFFAGLTNPKHEARMKLALVDVCNAAVETLVKTSHQVLTSDSHQQEQNVLVGDDVYQHELSAESKEKSCSSVEDWTGGWIEKLSSALTESRNKRFVLDLTEKVTFETAKSLLEFLLDKLNDSAEKFVTICYEGVVEGGLEVVQYVTAKCSAVTSLLLSLYQCFLGTLWGLVTA